MLMADVPHRQAAQWSIRLSCLRIWWRMPVALARASLWSGAGANGLTAPLRNRERVVSVALALIVQTALIAAIIGLAPPLLRPKARPVAVFGLGVSTPATVSPERSIRPSASGAPPVSSAPAVNAPAALSRSESAPGSVEQPATAAGTGNSCDVAAALQSKLQANEAVRASLAAIPAHDRSVANAITVWNSGWVNFDAAPVSSPMAIIRDVILQTIASAATECRLQPQTGPQLIFVTGTPGTTVLALGSGAWRWDDLLDPPPDPPDGTTEP